MKDFLFARVQKTYGMKTLDDSTTTELRNLARSRTAELQLIRNRRQKRVREDVGRRRREQRKRETPVTGGGGEDQGEHKRRGKDEITAKREVKATRKDRRDTAAEDEVLAKGRDSDQEPQPLSPRRYCQICFVTLTTATAPCSGITSTCKHEPDFCLPCLHRNIDIQMASKLWNQITCPHSHCRSTLEYADVKKVAARSSFERYDNYVLSQALGEIDDFVKCAHEGCTFSGLADKQRENFMICAACEGKTCLGCKRIWHGELSCGKNAEKLESDQTTRIRQEAASKKYLEKKSKRCPNCGVKIIKHSGCNHMTCKCFGTTWILPSRREKEYTDF